MAWRSLLIGKLSVFSRRTGLHEHLHEAALSHAVGSTNYDPPFMPLVYFDCDALGGHLIPTADYGAATTAGCTAPQLRACFKVDAIVGNLLITSTFFQEFSDFGLEASAMR